MPEQPSIDPLNRSIQDLSQLLQLGRLRVGITEHRLEVMASCINRP